MNLRGVLYNVDERFELKLRINNNKYRISTKKSTKYTKIQILQKSRLKILNN